MWYFNFSKYLLFVLTKSSTLSYSILFVLGVNAYYENENEDEEDEDIDDENWQRADAERLALERIRFEGLVEERIAEEVLKFEADKRNGELRLAEERRKLEENKRDAEWQLAEERRTFEANKRDAELYISGQTEARERAEWQLSETLKANSDAARQQDLRLEAVEKRHREEKEEATAAAEKMQREAQEEAAAAEKRHRETQEEAAAAAEKRNREAQEQQRAAAAAAADRSNSIAKVLSSPQNSDLENQGTNLISTSPRAASPAFSMGSIDRREDHTSRSFLERATGDDRKEEYLNHRLGRVHQGANMDKRLNATKNKGRNKRDTKVTKRRTEGTSQTTMQQAPDVASPILRRSLRGDRSVPQSPGMWNHIAEGGLLQDQDIHEQGGADEEASMDTM